MKKRFNSLCLIFLFLLLLFPLACKSPHGPDSPTKYEDVVEFMYERTKPVVDNTSTDPQGFSIWNDELGGKSVGPLIYLGNDRWMGERLLIYSEVPFWVCTIDMKVTGAYEAVAETFYARIQGTNEWTELTCIGPDPNGTGGLAAKFYLDDKGIRIP